MGLLRLRWQSGFEIQLHISKSTTSFAEDVTFSAMQASKGYNKVCSDSFCSLSGMWEMLEFQRFLEKAFFPKYKYFAEVITKTVKEQGWCQVYTRFGHWCRSRKKPYFNNCIRSTAITLSVKGSCHVLLKIDRYFVEI